MCGIDGTGLPSWRTSTPLSYVAPASSSAETNCEDADASITTCPPGTAPSPRTTNGSAPRPSSSTVTPRPRSAVSTSPTGRLAHVRVAVEGHRPGGQRRDRRHEPQHRPGEPAVDVGVAVERARTSPPSRHRWCRPRRRATDSAVAISTVSRDRRARRTTLGPSARAAITSARLVSDLLPGSETVDVDRSARARRRPRVDVRRHPAQPSRLISVVEVRGAQRCLVTHLDHRASGYERGRFFSVS